MTSHEVPAAPWDRPDLVALALAMDHSHRTLLGSRLTQEPSTDPLATAERLYGAEFALLCHDGGADPVFVGRTLNVLAPAALLGLCAIIYLNSRRARPPAAP